MIEILQNSLAENERVKQRQLVAFAVLFLGTLTVLLWIGLSQASPPPTYANC